MRKAVITITSDGVLCSACATCTDCCCLGLGSGEPVFPLTDRDCQNLKYASKATMIKRCGWRNYFVLADPCGALASSGCTLGILRPNLCKTFPFVIGPGDTIHAALECPGARAYSINALAELAKQLSKVFYSRFSVRELSPLFVGPREDFPGPYGEYDLGIPYDYYRYQQEVPLLTYLQLVRSGKISSLGSTIRESLRAMGWQKFLEEHPVKDGVLRRADLNRLETQIYRYANKHLIYLV